MEFIKLSNFKLIIVAYTHWLLFTRTLLNLIIFQKYNNFLFYYIIFIIRLEKKFLWFFLTIKFKCIYLSSNKTLLIKINKYQCIFGNEKQVLLFRLNKILEEINSLNAVSAFIFMWSISQEVIEMLEKIITGGQEIRRVWWIR